MRTNRANSEETLTNLRISGAQYSWAHSGSLSNVQTCSLYTVALRLSQATSTIEYMLGVGLDGHGVYGSHQTFIPAFNSTTARVERPDSEGRRIESSKVKFSTYERQTDQINILLVFHHLNCSI